MGGNIVNTLLSINVLYGKETTFLLLQRVLTRLEVLLAALNLEVLKTSSNLCILLP
jgi:hypothetical protein